MKGDDDAADAERPRLAAVGAENEWDGKLGPVEGVCSEGIVGGEVAEASVRGRESAIVELGSGWRASE